MLLRQNFGVWISLSCSPSNDRAANMLIEILFVVERSWCETFKVENYFRSGKGALLPIPTMWGGEGNGGGCHGHSES